MTVWNTTLLCFDGSEDAASAIAEAGRVLAPRRAVVLTAWEPVEEWEPYDPVTILTAPLERLVANATHLDEIVRDLAREKMERGVTLATDAGFETAGRLVKGKPWRVICAVGEEVNADPIVVGARGLGRIQAALLGSVSTAVVFHAKRPVLVVPREDGS
jgi:nucleotide-binding universal stress UspA family protein